MINLKNSVLVLLISIACFFCFGQTGIGSFGNAYIHSNSEIGMHGKLHFSNNQSGAYPGIIVTNRNSDAPGIVAFGENGSWENAADDRHIDGYAKVYHDREFTFPIGNLGYYKPVTISGAYATAAAYYLDNPSKLPFIPVSTRSSSSSEEKRMLVSDVEYWDIDGSNETRITFYWDTNSNVDELTNNNLEDLTIAGWNGTSWEIIPSSIDIDKQSSTKVGSITSNFAVVPDTYEVFTFASLSSAVADREVRFGSNLSENGKIEFTLFPNPSSNISQVNVDYDFNAITSDADLIIYNDLGELIYKQDLDLKKDIIKIPFTSTQSGFFHIGIVTEGGSRVFKPLVITK